MRNTTRKLVAFLLMLTTVLSLAQPTTAYADVESGTEAKTSTVEIQTYQVKNEETPTTTMSTDFLKMFNKRLSEQNTDCKHEFTSIQIRPTCKRFGYTVSCCDYCEQTYVKDFVPASAHKFSEFNVTFNGKEEKHRICVVCEYEEIANQKVHARYYSGNETMETVWLSYKATVEQREIIKQTLNSMGIILETDKVIEDVPGYIWDFLMEKIGNPYGVAGIMGNMFCESGLRSINLQNSYEHSLGYSDEEYTNAVDNGNYTRFSKDSAGYGLVQWTSGGRKAGLYKYAKETNRSIGDLDMQLEYLWYELITDYPNLTSQLQNASSIREASTAFLVKFERPADQGEGARAHRASCGQKYFDKYCG